MCVCCDDSVSSFKSLTIYARPSVSVRLNKRAVRQTMTKEKNKKEEEEEEEGNEYDTRMRVCIYLVERRFTYRRGYLF